MVIDSLNLKLVSNYTNLLRLENKVPPPRIEFFLNMNTIDSLSF